MEERTFAGGRGRRPAAERTSHVVGRVMGAFNLPFGRGLLTFRAGQRVLAHPELKAAIDRHRLPVVWEPD